MNPVDLPPPAIAYDAARFLIPPEVVVRADGAFLRYQMNADPSRMSARLHVVIAREPEKAVAYFSGHATALEWGTVVEIPLRLHGVEELAHSGRVIWRNPDGSEIPVPVHVAPN